MKAGLVLIIAGTWVLCQVLGGDALQRLNITSGGSSSGTSTGSGSGSGGNTSNGSSGGSIGQGFV